MPDASLWKYCTMDHCKEYLGSLKLLGDTDWPIIKQIACLYALSNHADKHYRVHALVKRDGTLRRILEPDPLLKAVQRNILHHVLDGLSISPYATAYRRGATILANASPHVGAKRVLKLDIEAFFESIAFPTVRRQAFPDIYFPLPVSTLLAHLCCYHDHLPQGAPTSAAISNRVMRPFDEHMGPWCAQRGIAYTRYSDDMTFSGGFDERAVRDKAAGFLSAMGFALNQTKTRSLRANSRQIVTGVVVNQKPQAPREDRRRLRQEVHYCQRYGVASHLARMGDARYLPPDPEHCARYLRSLLGRVDFVLQLNPDDACFARARRSVLKMISEGSSSV